MHHTMRCGAAPHALPEWPSFGKRAWKRRKSSDLSLGIASQAVSYILAMLGASLASQCFGPTLAGQQRDFTRKRVHVMQRWFINNQKLEYSKGTYQLQPSSSLLVRSYCTSAGSVHV